MTARTRLVAGAMWIAAIVLVALATYPYLRPRPGVPPTHAPNQPTPDSPSDQVVSSPALWVLAVGVSDYQDPSLRLQYAHADAMAVAAELEQQGGGGLYSGVRSLVLTNEKVTRASILEDGHRFLSQAAPGDVAVIFLAGHGVQDRVTKSYYFVPYDANAKSLRTQGLRMSDFDEMIRALRRKVRAVVAILDTCHSGALGIDSPEEIDGVDLTQSLSTGEGVFLIAASGPGEESVALAELEHGVFTHALLVGLRGEADLDKNGEVSVYDLFSYIAKYVRQLTKDRQNPHLDATGGDLILASTPIHLTASRPPPEARRIEEGTRDDVTHPNRSPFSEQFEHLPPSELLNYIGQLFLVGIPETGDRLSALPSSRRLVEDPRFNIGGFLFFGRNTDNSDPSVQRTAQEVAFTLASATANLRTMATGAGSLPPFLAIDHEGGTTSLLMKRNVTTQIPSMMAIGATRCSQYARLAGEVAAAEIGTLGFNLLLGPVADVNINRANDLIRDRSFGSDYDFVGQMVVQYLAGLSEFESRANPDLHDARSCVLAVVKHFPGHGHTWEGFHTPGLPASRYNTVTFRRSLEPFRMAVQAGVGALMTSHMRFQWQRDPGSFLFSRDMKPLIRDASTHVATKEGLMELTGLQFQGLTIADDVAAPCVTVEKDETDLDRESYIERVIDSVRRAFDAENDMFIIGGLHEDHVDDNTLSGRRADGSRYPVGLRVSDLGRVLDALREHVEGSPGRMSALRAKVKRIAQAKWGLRDGCAQVPGEAWSFLQSLKEIYGQRVEDIWRQSFIVVGDRSPLKRLSNCSKGERVAILQPSPHGRMWAQYANGLPQETRLGRCRTEYLGGALDRALPGDCERDCFFLEKLPGSEQERIDEAVNLIAARQPSILVGGVTNNYQWNFAVNLVREMRGGADTPLAVRPQVVLVVHSQPTYLDFEDEGAAELLQDSSVVVAFSTFGAGADVLAREMIDAPDRIGTGSAFPVEIEGLGEPEFAVDPSGCRVQP